MSVRKAHNSGRNHLRNVIEYYQRTWHALNSVGMDYVNIR
jgi:U1 small nuclear ribonucleoprotein C